MKNPKVYKQIVDRITSLFYSKEIGILNEQESEEIEFILEHGCLTLDFVNIICVLESLPNVHLPLATIEEDFEYMIKIDRK